MAVRHYLFAIVWAIFMTLLILLPGHKMPETPRFIGFDKIAHAGVFFVLTILASIGFKKHKEASGLRSKTIFIVFLSCLLYGAGLEFVQGFVPEREFDIHDIFANISGVLLGIFAFKIIYKL